MNSPRVRTLPAAAALLRELDPQTAVTLTALRRMVKRGEIPAVEAGTKRLINFDALLEHLATPPVSKLCATPPETSKLGMVRRVDL